MIEFIKHALGICGEPHASVLYLLPVFMSYLILAKSHWKTFFEYVKTLL